MAKPTTAPAATTDEQPAITSAAQYEGFLQVVVALGEVAAQVAKPDDELWPLLNNLLGRAASIAKSLAESGDHTNVVLSPQFDHAMKGLHVVIRKLRDDMVP